MPFDTAEPADFTSKSAPSSDSSGAEAAAPGVVSTQSDLVQRRESANPFSGNKARPLGNLIRLRPLHPSELPPHPSLASLQSTPSATQQDPQFLHRFVTAAIEEAWAFNDYTVEASFQKNSIKASPPAQGKVRVLSHTYAPADLAKIPWQQSAVPRKPPRPGDDYAREGEAWFARRSRHQSVSRAGSANFAEFDHGLRYNHSEHEGEYTPDVLDAHRVLSWHDQLEAGTKIGDFRDVDMSIYEMVHNIPWPLYNRAFAVLVLTATIQHNGFIVVQIPVDLSEVPDALYSNGRNMKEGRDAKLRKGVVVGLYTSIERVFLGDDEHNWWQMATASDAKGSLPLWLQKMFMPSKIRKDVGLFIEWIGRSRKTERPH